MSLPSIKPQIICGVIAVLSFAGFVRLVTIGGIDGPDAAGRLVAAAGLTLIFGIATWVIVRSDRRARAADASGPAAPRQGPSAIGMSGAAGPWPLDMVASQLAHDLAPMQGVVFREGDSSTMRIMLDPRSAIRRVRKERRWQDEDPSDHHSRRSWTSGEWWQVVWRAGHAPRVRARDSEVGARILDGQLVPVWSTERRSGSDTAPSTSMALATPPATDGRVEVSETRLLHVIGDVAVRSGWSTAEQVESAGWQVPADRGERVVTRRVTGGEEAATGSAGPPPSIREAQSDMVRISAVVGLGVLAACVIATVIGLAFGMVWWASLIIIGSGLVFCLLFLLPALLLGPPKGMDGLGRFMRD